jgi:hypothetical protein
MASYANTLTDAQRAQGLTFNTEIIPDPLEAFVWLVALRDIAPGEEILYDYGPAYSIGGPL